MQFFKPYLAFALFILPTLIHAQIIFKGSVANKTTGEKIPYATIGLIKENTGGTANKEGIFEFTSYKPQPNDTLIISCIGFAVLKVPVLKDVAEYIFQLSPATVALPEIVVTRRTNTQVKLNDFSNSINHFLATVGFHVQAAQYFETTEKYGWLRSVRLLVSRQNCSFRLRIYGVDSVTGLPSGDLYDKSIDVNKSNNSRVTTIDLSDYEIYIPGKSFFVALEWLKIPQNKLDFGGPGIDMYLPSLGLTGEAKTTSKSRICVLDYTNKWSRFIGAEEKGDLAIGVTISY
ncbi:MAG: carboxypeptidase-like regulatory domain-containing protein [Chitinophagaceae bacterium]